MDVGQHLHHCSKPPATTGHPACGAKHTIKLYLPSLSVRHGLGLLLAYLGDALPLLGRKLPPPLPPSPPAAAPPVPTPPSAAPGYGLAPLSWGEVPLAAAPTSASRPLRPSSPATVVAMICLCLCFCGGYRRKGGGGHAIASIHLP